MANSIYEGKHFLYNSDIRPINVFDPAWLSCHKIIYEVIRVVNCCPVFLDYHLERLNRSCILSGFEAIDMLRIKTTLTQFISQEWEQEKNIKLSLCFSSHNDSNPLLLAHYIPSSYPTPAMYSNGVSVGLLPQIRPKPNVKVQNQPLREMADEMMSAYGYFELLLVNGAHCITEGSRSNFFVVRGDTIITPPAIDVLEGITRGIVIELAHKHNIECLQEPVHLDSIPTYQGAFLTGTSPMILPIKSIGQHIFPTILPLIQHLMSLYSREMRRGLPPPDRHPEAKV